MTQLPLLPEQHLAPDRREELADKLIVQLRTDPRPARNPHRRRTLILAGVAGVVLAGGGTAAAYQLFGSAPVTNHSVARCYRIDTTDFGANFDGTTVSEPRSTAGAGGEIIAPISACAEAWRMGAVQGIAPTDAHPPYPVPHLVGCVLPSGIAAVFPGPAGTCQTLGLPVAAKTR